MIRTVVREPAAVPVTVELAFENQRAHHVTLEPGIHSASPEPLCQTVGPVRMFLKYDGPLAAPTGAVFRGADSKMVSTTSVTALVVKFDSNGCPRAKSRVIGEPSSGEAQPTWENRCVRMLALRYRDISVGDVVLYSRNGKRASAAFLSSSRALRNQIGTTADALAGQGDGSFYIRSDIQQTSYSKRWKSALPDRALRRCLVHGPPPGHDLRFG